MREKKERYDTLRSNLVLNAGRVNNAGIKLLQSLEALLDAQETNHPHKHMIQVSDPWLLFSSFQLIEVLE